MERKCLICTIEKDESEGHKYTPRQTVAALGASGRYNPAEESERQSIFGLVVHCEGIIQFNNPPGGADDAMWWICNSCSSKYFKSSGDVKSHLEIICDCCSTKITANDFYTISTTQAVCSQAYWQFVFQNGDRMTGGRLKSNPTIIFPEEVRRLAGQSSAWAICPKCVDLFDIDRTKAKQWAELAIKHRGKSLLPDGYILGWDAGTPIGSADVNKAFEVAIAAWKKQYGFIPDVSPPSFPDSEIVLSYEKENQVRVVGRLSNYDVNRHKKWWQFWK